MGRFLAAVVLGAALAATPALAGSQGGAVGVRRATTLEAQVLAQMNTVRARHGLVALRLSTRLGAAAGQHTTEMARRGYFEHESASGASMASRLRGFYPSSNRSSMAFGENLLWASPSIEAQGALNVWMGSSGHRQNLLSRRWRAVGIAAVHADSAPGVYDGLEVTIVTADFAVRR